MGVEPTLPAWKAVTSLDATREFYSEFYSKAGRSLLRL